jgi:predicted transposase YbfD/YdcC
MKWFTAEDLGIFEDCFEEVDDPRSDVNKIHPLIGIIFISIAAVIAGADGPTAINRWANEKSNWLMSVLNLTSGIPSRDCIRVTLGILDTQALQKGYMAWLELFLDKQDNPESIRVVAIDGKSLRRSGSPKNNVNMLHLVSAWCSEHGISLGQVATEEKSNEITAIPELLDQIEIENAVITIDAMGMQKKITEKIKQKKADYVIAVKGNQKTLHNKIIEMFDNAVVDNWVYGDVHQHVTEDSGHGRDEVRYHYFMELAEDSPIRDSWPSANAVGMVVRHSGDYKGKKRRTVATIWSVG